MAVASSRRDSASSKWWSLAPKNSPTTSAKPKEPAAKSQSASKFNTLASAIGFKSKKHPSLAIQEPPYLSSASSPASANPSPIADSPNRQVPYINRPPSKSVSSTKSPVESIEPITPIEPFQSSPSRPHHRQSLFTLSDSDPFASHHGIQIDPQPPDPSRLSVYSGSSASDYGSKKFQSAGPNRTSYASSSFSSAGEQLSPTRCIEPIRSQVPKLKPRRSQGSLHRKVSLLSSDSALTSAWESLTHSADGKRPSTATSVSSIVVDPHRRSQPPPSPLPRPPMRARGLTDVGLRQPSSQPYPDDPSPSPLPSTLPASSNSHRLSPTFAPASSLRRKQSSPRIGGPPSAPPTQDLPLPPAHANTHNADDDSDILPDHSASSSSLSFASSVSSRDINLDKPRKLPSEEKSVDPYGRSRTTERVSRENIPPPRPDPMYPPPLHSPPTSPQTVKRVLSQQSLSSRRRTSTSSTASGPPADLPYDKAPRKQRSYPRIPVPPLPQSLRHASSFGPLNALSSQPTPTQRTASAQGLPPSRIRLFSNPASGRPSTSQCTPVDDDIRSVFSLPLEQERMQGLSLAANMGPSSRPSLHVRSSLDSGSIDEPSSPSTSDYTPRRIKSPAELLKIEASVHETAPSYVRARGLSFTSMSTTMSDLDDIPSMPHSPPTSLHLLPTLPPHTGSPLRSASMLNKAPNIPRLAVRPSTSQATVSPPSSPTHSASPRSQFFFPTASNPPPMTTSLPPPPRPRPPRPSTAPFPSPPDPPPPNPVTQPLRPAPPARKKSLISLSAEKMLQRRSLMRKPSFLEIDDDLDIDDRRRSVNANGSFLDLARESFDTVRTINE